MKADDNIRMRQDGRNSNGDLILEWGAGWENKQNGLTSELKLRRFSREFHFCFWVAVRLGQWHGGNFSVANLVLCHHPMLPAAGRKSMQFVPKWQWTGQSVNPSKEFVSDSGWDPSVSSNFLMMGATFSPSLEKLCLGYALLQGCGCRGMVSFAAARTGSDALKPDRWCWPSNVLWRVNFLLTGSCMCLCVCSQERPIHWLTHVSKSKMQQRSNLLLKRQNLVPSLEWKVIILLITILLKLSPDINQPISLTFNMKKVKQHLKLSQK